MCLFPFYDGINVWKERGGTGISAAFEFFSFLWSNSRLLGLENSSDVIKYPFVGLTKTLFGVKFVVKISRDGTKEVFNCRAYARTPPPNPLLFV